MSDLRVHDNASLNAAAEASRRSPTGAFVAGVLSSALPAKARPLAASLARQIDTLGSTLLSIVDTAQVATLCKQLDLHAVHMNFPSDSRGAKVVTGVKKALNDSGIELVLHWGGYLVSNPTSSMLSPSSTQTKSKKDKMTVMSLRSDIVKQGVQKTTTLAQTPDSLPQPPAQARSFQTLGHSSSPVDATKEALSLLNKSFDKSAELLRLSKTPDAAVALKVYIDHGAISLRMIARHVATAFGGQFKGRTFSELVWRNYVSLSANVSLAKSVKTRA